MWQDIMVTMLRYMVNDYNSPQIYDDNTLTVAILVNSIFVNQELNFIVSFNSDIINLTLTPDPTTLPDYNFVNLVVLRTAVMIVMNEYKVAANSAFSFKEFHSAVDLKGVATAKKLIWEELQKLYDDKRMAYQMGIRVSGKAILSPINIFSGGWRGGATYLWADRGLFGY